MKLLTSRLNEHARSAVRFVIVGGIGTGIQYALYYAFLLLFRHLYGEEDSAFWANVAFILGFGLEVIGNYILTCYYTFERKPSWKNAGGFAAGRLSNFAVQIGLLNILILPWIGMDERWAGIVAIAVAGVVNYFVLKFLYKKV